MQPRLWLLVAVTVTVAVKKLAALQGSSHHQQTPSSLVLQTNQEATMDCEVKGPLNNVRIYWLRQRQAPGKDSYYEFLVSEDLNKNTAYGKNVTPGTLTLSWSSRGTTRFILSLKHTKPEDSGVYFCMTMGSPELNFGTGTSLSVVDVLPTTAQPTKKTTPKKKKCQPPSPGTQKGLRCGLITLSLLVGGALLLLLSLAVAVHLYCLRRRARLRFIKQFYR
ncbi:T-cell surface glycoprotein CD8 beta chain [Octodon degus]|uniref:T-cell surface glycoprotein CD8 beta chain n=1 Tax=Octodon degus TaxID=10160 RepID=A0A6P3FR48_OCTDE|nr:T-cell surface glycoprotein CD8 beta chain [Octodon degus]